MQYKVIIALIFRALSPVSKVNGPFNTLSLIFTRLDFCDVKKYHKVKVPPKEGAAKIKDMKFRELHKIF